MKVNKQWQTKYNKQEHHTTTIEESSAYREMNVSATYNVSLDMKGCIFTVNTKVQYSKRAHFSW